ncbi:MAG: hypothetical protein ACOCP8_06175 [archaeon]
MEVKLETDKEIIVNSLEFYKKKLEKMKGKEEFSTEAVKVLIDTTDRIEENIEKMNSEKIRKFVRE